MNRLQSLSFGFGASRHLWRGGISFLSLFLVAVALNAQPAYDFVVAQEPYSMLSPGQPMGILPSPNLAALDLEGEGMPIYGHRLYPDSDTPIIVFGNGLIRLDEPGHNTAIDALLMELAPLDDRSGVFFQVDEVGEEKIVKLEWRYAAIIDTPDVPDDYVNFQIWLYENSGVIELRYGPNKLAEDYGQQIGGGPFAGIFQSTPWDSLFFVEQKNWLIGDPTEPLYDRFGQDLPPLAGIPPEGTVYRFTPHVTSAVATSAGVDAEGYHLFPNPTTGKVRVEAPQPLLRNAQVHLIDALGRTVGEFEMEVSSSVLELDLPHPGVYYCRIVGENGSRIYRVVRQ